MLYGFQKAETTTDGIRRKLARYDAMSDLARLAGHVLAVGFVLLFITYNGLHVVPVIGGLMVAFGCEVVASIVAVGIQSGNAEEWRNVLDHRIDEELRRSRL